MWILWDDAKVGFTPLVIDEQFIHGKVDINQTSFLITTIYGLHSVTARSSMWLALTGLAKNIQSP